ncbi:MAG: hypothetical protein AAF431_15325 [Pseudomonadota bacterium]
MNIQAPIPPAEPMDYPGVEGLSINQDALPGSQPLERPEPIIKVDNLEYFLWDIPDLDKQQEFLEDFGLKLAERSEDVLYMRSFGPSPYAYIARKAKKAAFIGTGFSVTSRGDLETLARQTECKIESLDRPGGGEVVRLVDPMGFVVEVVHGIETVAELATRREPLPVNYPNSKTRINREQRPAYEPAAILNAGHVVLSTHSLQDTATWYMRHIGLIPTDVACATDGSVGLAFMRLDRGEQPADHHSLVLLQGGGELYLHSAFEVFDLDSIGQGQQYMLAKRHKHFWGIGRHILGSQLFDYWLDPNGYELEHYADGDMYTADRPTNYHPMDPGNIYAWGHDMPKAVVNPGFKQVLSVLRGVIRKQISPAWLGMAKRIMSRPARPWL